MADSAPPPPYRGLEANLFPPISQSDADIELRFYGNFQPNKRSMVCVRYYPDTVFFERITGRLNSKHAALPENSRDSLAYANDGNYYDWTTELLNPGMEPSVFIDSFIKKRLLNPPTFEELKAVILKSRKDVIGEDTAHPRIKYSISNIPHTVFHYEVKIGNRYMARDLYTIRYEDDPLTIFNYVSYGPYVSYINLIFTPARVIAIRELKNDRVP